MSSLSIRYRPEPCRTRDFSSISGAYMSVGTALDHPASQIFVQNLTDETLWFSLDGLTDHFPLPANGYFLSDISSNKARGEGLFLAKGDRLYVKEVSDSPTLGGVYFTSFYGSDS